MVAGTLKSLGFLFEGRSDFAKAKQVDLRGLAILERLGLTEKDSYGEFLNNLGIIFMDLQELDQAKTYLERALAFQEKHYGQESLAISKVLNNLGIVARKQKDYPAAEKCYVRTLAIKEKSLGADHPEYAAALMNLANVYASEGDYRKALDTHLRVLSIFEKSLVPGELPPILSLANVTKNYAAVGDFENANRVQARLEAALERNIAFNLAIGSERQKLAFLDAVAQRTERAISLNLQLEPDNPQAAFLATTVLLQRKGRLLDAMTDTLSTLWKHSDPQDQVLLDELKGASAQFARTALKGRQQQSLEEYRKNLQSLQEQKEKLENAISHHNEQFRAQAQAITAEAVQSAVPDGAALLEFVAYHPFNPKAQTDAEQFGDLRYAAYVLHHTGPPRGIDLGEAKAIDVLTQNFRAALREPTRGDVKQLAQAVGSKVFQPLQLLVRDDKRLLISPDGQLDLIPFEALADNQGSYLVKRYSISYLTTGRDLLRLQVPRPSRSAPVIVADPLFGEPEETLVASAAVPAAKPVGASGARRSVTAGADFASLYFAPLAGTKAEAQNIQALYPEARVLTGEQASKAALDVLRAPSVLHIATHGFFLENPHQENGATAASKTGGTGKTEDLENPLLRSGLALRGANLAKDGKETGILTALEASNLDLWGTKLVTLSACDTGVGEVKNGEGVYGLRRSFFLAGAETLVMSLWPVSDYVAREMMVSYYSGLKDGLGRGEALRRAQLAMMKRQGRQHPFYWASFIQSGEWANLEGRR
jgi:CHAT domain-containing protein